MLQGSASTVTVSLALALSTFASPLAADGVTVERADGKLRVEIDGELFTEYVYSETPKPILYPVIGPHGIPMTRNFPMKEGVPGEAPDHRHHRSLWFTHGDINGISFWHEGKDAGTTVQEEILEAASGKERGTIRTRNRWVGPDGKVVCTDVRTLHFQELEKGRAIDVEITIHASSGELTFGDTKEGTMGIRTHPALRLRDGKGEARNSAGDTGRSVWGKRAKWVDYWAPIEGKVVGVAIFDHPSNPVHPTWWHARDYGLIAANPFGVHDFEKKPPHTGDLTVPAGESITFRYRFLFHEGDVEEADIPEAYAAFAKTEGSSS